MGTYIHSRLYFASCYGLDVYTPVLYSTHRHGNITATPLPETTYLALPAAPAMTSHQSPPMPPPPAVHSYTFTLSESLTPMHARPIVSPSCMHPTQTTRMHSSFPFPPAYVPRYPMLCTPRCIVPTLCKTGGGWRMYVAQTLRLSTY
jgi:hypothetical protein